MSEYQVWKIEPLGAGTRVWLSPALPAPPPQPKEKGRRGYTSSLELRLGSVLLSLSQLFCSEVVTWRKQRVSSKKEEGRAMRAGGRMRGYWWEVVRLSPALIPQLTPPRGSEHPGAGQFKTQRGAGSELPKIVTSYRGPKRQ